MPPDMRTLLSGLEEYQRQLDRHRQAVAAGFEEVSRSWTALDAVFQGHAADEFRPVWQRSADGFAVYTEETGAIAAMLAARIEALRRAERGDR